jgi:hypothetical protein
LRPLSSGLTDHELHQRRIELWSRLETIGEVTRATDDVLPRGRRLLRIEVALPGWGLPLDGTLVFIERSTRSGDVWELTSYTYDYHREPRPSGRKAHHYHDGVLHGHCDDPRQPRRIDHYRDVEVGLLEAAEEFRSIHLRGEVDCSGLFPLVSGEPR